MKKNFLALLILVATNATHAQQKFCAGTEVAKAWFAKHPEKEKAYLAARLQQLNNIQSNGAKLSAAAADYTIPVVFHVLTNGGAENISDAQILDAIRILNRDFNRQNPDTTMVVPAFKSMIADVKIHFQLASLDPWGLCTDGIIRHAVQSTEFSADSGAYLYTWPHDQYMNIYVVGSFPSWLYAAAFAYMPGMGMPANQDCIVSLHSYVGGIGTSSGSRARVLTHEVGHWLGLEHTWGWADCGTVCGDDLIGDTPPTMGFVTCDLANAAICNPPVVENVQNYMDYSNCNKMFTPGQAQWMTQTLNTAIDGRDNLSLPGNLDKTGIINIEDHCATRLKVTPYPTARVCVGTTLTAMSYTSLAGVSSYSWSADNGAIVVSPTSHSTQVVITGTALTVLSCVATNNAGSAVESVYITGINTSPEVNASWYESFEKGALPDGWENKSTAQLANWQVYQGAGSHGYNSVYLQGELLGAGEESTLETASYDFSELTQTTFTFKYAYARAAAYHQDIFRVKASTDCGRTWNDIYAPAIGVFAQGSAGVNSTPFLPADNHWKKVDLGAQPGFKNLLGQPNVRLRFYFKEDPQMMQAGNRIFLDEINFFTTVGLAQNHADLSLGIYPQPGREIRISFFTATKMPCSFRLCNLAGELVEEQYLPDPIAGNQEITLNNAHKLAPGVYFLSLAIGDSRVFRKVIIE